MRKMEDGTDKPDSLLLILFGVLMAAVPSLCWAVYTQIDGRLTRVEQNHGYEHGPCSTFEGKHEKTEPKSQGRG